MLTSPHTSAVAHLWGVVDEVHMGQIVRELLEERKQKHRAVADAAGMKPANFSDMLQRKDIGDDILAKVGKAMGVNLLEVVRFRQDQAYGREPAPVVSEPIPPYGQQHGGPELVVHLDDYTEEMQLKILRFIQQVPKRGAEKKR